MKSPSSQTHRVLDRFWDNYRSMASTELDALAEVGFSLWFFFLTVRGRVLLLTLLFLLGYGAGYAYRDELTAWWSGVLVAAGVLLCLASLLNLARALQAVFTPDTSRPGYLAGSSFLTAPVRDQVCFVFLFHSLPVTGFLTGIVATVFPYYLP